MKVAIRDDGLLIVPETEFEEKFLTSKFKYTKSYSAFLKGGLTPKEIVGVQVKFKEDE